LRARLRVSDPSGLSRLGRDKLEYPQMSQFLDDDKYYPLTLTGLLDVNTRMLNLKSYTLLAIRAHQFYMICLVMASILLCRGRSPLPEPITPHSVVGSSDYGTGPDKLTPGFYFQD
jgi:hypothetical protein